MEPGPHYLAALSRTLPFSNHFLPENESASVFLWNPVSVTAKKSALPRPGRLKGVSASHWGGSGGVFRGCASCAGNTVGRKRSWEGPFLGRFPCPGSPQPLVTGDLSLHAATPQVVPGVS